MSALKILFLTEEPKKLHLLRQIIKDADILSLSPCVVDSLPVVQSFRPEIIIVDSTLIKIDAFLVCDAIRKTPGLQEARLLYLSANFDFKIVEKAYTHGCDDILADPFIAQELLSKMNGHRKIAKAEAALNNYAARVASLEKDAFLGRQTAEIVHNINNPLSILMATLNRLESLYPSEERLPRALVSVKRISDTTKSILHASRGGNELKREPLSLNDLLMSELKLMEHESFFKNHIHLHMDLSDLPKIEGACTHFSQVFGNLIKNAVESMHESKTKELRVRTAFVDHHVRIEFVDTGCGISPSNLEKIFDPFFTTKPLLSKNGEPTGTGLGLPSVKRMLETYGATIEVESHVGLGTRIILHIPMESKLPEANLTSELKVKHRPAPLPESEDLRLQALHRLEILDLPPDDSLNQVAAEAARMISAPIACINLIDENQMFVKAAFNLTSIRNIDRKYALCAYTILGHSPLIVEDTLLDERFASNPFIRGRDTLHFYAGFPLITREGHAVGTLCLFDHKPRSLTQHQVEQLQRLAAGVMTHFEKNDSTPLSA